MQLKNHPLYSTFVGVRQRCTYPSYAQFEDYGGRGIEIFEEWLSDTWKFINYVQENLGPKPHGHTLDRVDNNKGYEPGNLRWATRTTNARNRRNNILVTVNGVTKCLAEWAHDTGMPATTLYSRLQRGWSSDTLLVPPRKKTPQ